MKANTNISLRTRQVLSLNDLRGADFTSSPLSASPNRAVDMKNWINEGGVLRKRPGWRQEWQIPEGARINGVFYYEHKEHRALLVHAGDRMYRIINPLDTSSIPTEIDEEVRPRWIQSAETTRTIVQNRKSSFFYRDGRCYILCGGYLVYGTWDNGTSYRLRLVSDCEDVYIPTTTVSIDPYCVADTQRASLDAVNRLTLWRKNILVGGEANDGYRLDAEEIEPSSVRVEIKTNTETLRLKSAHQLDNAPSGMGSLAYALVDDINVVKGWVEQDGHIGFHDSYVLADIGRGNITVTFCVKESFERTQSREMGVWENQGVGVTFGIGGYSDRLFLSGNSLYPHIVFYSEMDDYTYFPDNFYAVIGAKSAPVTGFSRLSDGVLAIHKRDGFYDPTIYYMTANLDTQYSEGGQIEKQTAVFSFTPGAIGEGCVSAYATANLSGDPVFLSENGLFGLVLPENTATSSRFAKERSYAISSRLRQHADLSKAVGVVYKNRYYLALDGVCYVADARYKFYRENDADASFNYEWWYWDNVPARVWLVWDDKLYFGTDDGRICRFDEEYTDRTFLDTEIGDLTVNEAGEIVCNVEIGNQLRAGDRIFLHDGDKEIYAELGRAEAKEGRLFLSEDACVRMREGMCVYVKRKNNSTELTEKIPYMVESIDYELCAVTLSLGGVEVSPTSGSYDLLRSIANQELYVSLIDEDWNGRNTFGIRETPEGEILHIVRDYGLSFPLMLQAHILQHNHIVAEWITPYLNMGSDMIAKTLTRMTVTAESGTGGVLWFGYDTRNAAETIAAKNAGKFSFESLSFTDFSFDTGFAASYTVKKRVRNFNYIRFHFLSDDDKPCGLHHFGAEYKIHKTNGGLR